MPQPAIVVNDLWKEYVVGHAAKPSATFYEVLTGGLRAPLDWLRGAGSSVRSETPFWALQDVNFELAAGDVMGVVGRNGAGKSTLLKILSRITAPSRGRIEMRGRLSSLLEVGTGFHPELSGRENIFLNGAILGMSRREVMRKFDEIVAFAEIDNFVDTPVKRYSSGMYVRLAFSVAAHLDPDILVIDEVLAVGDMQFQKKCLGKLETVAQGGRSVLFVSHNLTAIESLCTKALLLDKGRLVCQGAVSDVVERYISASRNQVLVRELDTSPHALENETMRVRSVSVRSATGEPLHDISSGETFVVDVDYDITRDGAFAGMTVIVYDMHNNVVFSSISNHEPSWYGRAMPAGRYTSSCTVPGNFLNAGWFRLGINIFGKGFSDARLGADILSFEIQDSGALRGDYYGDYGGSIRPQLQWRTEAREAVDG